MLCFAKQSEGVAELPNMQKAGRPFYLKRTEEMKMASGSQVARWRSGEVRDVEMKNETGSAMSFGHWATGPLGHSGGHSATEEGNVFIEYFVLALIVLLATIGFYTTQVRDVGAGARGQVESGFLSACAKVAGTNCDAVIGSGLDGM